MRRFPVSDPSIICICLGLYAQQICKDGRFKQYCKNKSEIQLCEDDLPDPIPIVSSEPYTEIRGGMKYEEYKHFLQPIEHLIRQCLISNATLDSEPLHCNFINRTILTNRKEDQYNSYEEQWSHCPSNWETKHYENIRCPGRTSQNMENCYTIFTLIGNPDKEQIQVQTDGVLMFEIEPYELEDNPDDHRAMADSYKKYHQIVKMTSFLSIHTPWQIINPYEDGFPLNRNLKYLFRLKKIIQKRLPPPYDTNCIDYQTMWKARGGRGPTTEKECVLECKKNVSLETHNCILSAWLVPSNELRCKEDLMPDDEVLDKIQKCIKAHCRPACYEEHYVVSFNTEPRLFQLFCDERHRYFSSNSAVEIYFNDMEVTTYTYNPKFQNIETFGYLGGYIGMWLGISLVAVFDFFETMVIMMKYPFRKFIATRCKKQRSNRVKKLQRDS